MNALSVFAPLRELDSLAKLFAGNALGAPDSQKPWTPSVDVTEDETGYRIVADLPEVPKDAVKVTVEDGVLTLRGERRWERKTDNTKVHIVERSYGTFSRSFRLPSDADAGKVNAGYKDGVLTVNVPKREESKPKEVEVTIH